MVDSGAITSQNQQEATFTGVIIPAEWDADGNPLSFALAAYDEQEYLIDSAAGAGREVAALGRQKVRITGSLGPFVANRRMITVTAYQRM